MKPMLTTQLRLHLANGVQCDAPIEVILVAFLRMLRPDQMAQLVANIEDIKGTQATQILMPGGESYIPFTGGASHG